MGTSLPGSETSRYKKLEMLMEERRGKEKKEICHGQKRSRVQDGQLSQFLGSQKQSPWFGKAFAFYLDCDVNSLESLE